MPDHPPTPLPARIAFLGFSDFERTALASYFRLASERESRFQLVVTLTDADYLVADADHGPSVQLVVVTERLAETVFIGSAAPKGAGATMHRPIDALHVMKALDALVAARGGSLPAPAAAPASRSSTAWADTAHAPTLSPEAGVIVESMLRMPAIRVPPPSPRPPAVIDITQASTGAPARPASAAVARPPPPVPAAAPPAIPASSAPLATLAPAAPTAPTARRTASRRAASAARTPPFVGPASPMKALVVDDSDIARRFLTTRLAPWGVRADSATTSTEALDRLAQSSYALIFLDVELGPDSELDGLALCRHIKHSALAMDATVVMVSAHHAEVDRARGALAGCDLYLGKPVKDAELVTLLRRQGLMPPEAPAARPPAAPPAPSVHAAAAEPGTAAPEPSKASPA